MISAFTKQHKIVRLWRQTWVKILIVSFNYLCPLAYFTFSSLYFPHDKMEMKQTVSVFYYSVTNHPKAEWLTATIYYFSQFFGLATGSSADFTWTHSCSFLQLEAPRWPHSYVWQLVLVVGWAISVLLHVAAYLGSWISFLTWHPKGSTQKYQGCNCKDSWALSSGTNTELIFGQSKPIIKGWGNRIHLLMGRPTKNFWPYLIYGT